MENWLIDIMNDLGYFGVFLLIALENVFPPIPSEIILTFGGFMTISTNLTVIGVILSATGGSVVGAITLYIIGLQLNVARLERIIDRWGHILRITKSDIHRADAWFDKYGAWTVFFCRFIPIIRSLISIPAGMSHMNAPLFLLLTTIGTLIWNTVLVLLGAKLGDSWDVIVHYMDMYSYVIYGLFIVAFLFILYRLLKRRT